MTALFLKEPFATAFGKNSGSWKLLDVEPKCKSLKMSHAFFFFVGPNQSGKSIISVTNDIRIIGKIGSFLLTHWKNGWWDSNMMNSCIVFWGLTTADQTADTADQFIVAKVRANEPTQTALNEQRGRLRKWSNFRTCSWYGYTLRFLWHVAWRAIPWECKTPQTMILFGRCKRVPYYQSRKFCLWIP